MPVRLPRMLPRLISCLLQCPVRTLLLPFVAVMLANCSDSGSNVQPAPREEPVDAESPDAEPPDSDASVEPTMHLPGLSAPVEVVRDTFGIVHIFARTWTDAIRAQGYAVAKDRAVQIELLRRTAKGRTAEILGSVSPDTIDQDIVMRTLDLAPLAEYEHATMQPIPRSWVQAFSEGISHHFKEIRDGIVPLPLAGSVFQPSHFEPFSAADALLIDKLMQFSMSWSVSEDIATSRLATATHNAATEERPGMLADLLRFAPLRSVTTLFDLDQPWTFAGHSIAVDTAFGTPVDTPAKPRDLASPFAGNEEVFASVQPALAAFDRASLAFGRFRTVGSNVWAVDPSRSVSGGSMLAVDAHVRLTSPAALWLVQLAITNEQGDDGPFVAGAAVPGVPGVAYAFNQHVAWSPAASGFDIADVYHERFGSDATTVLFRGEEEPIFSRQETIAIADAESIVVDVHVVPHHGPILPVLQEHKVLPLDANADALSIRWAGLGPTRDMQAQLNLLSAKGIEHVVHTVGANRSFVRSYVAASANEILYVAPVEVPRRDDRAAKWDASTYTGTLPCMVLPGDGRAEWLGRLPTSSIPVLQRPERGFVVTANADPEGGTLDNDPSNATVDGNKRFFACSFDVGFRQGRIRDLLGDANKKLSLSDAASVQADVHSALASRLVPHLIGALERAMQEREMPGTEPQLADLANSERFALSDPDTMIALLRYWANEGDFAVREGVNVQDMTLLGDALEEQSSRAALLYHAWLVRLLHNVFAEAMGTLEIGVQGIFDGFLAKPEGIPIRSLLHLLEAAPDSLATFDAKTGDSWLWDDSRTENVETRDERIVIAWLDAIAWMRDRLGADQSLWRWGLQHTVRLSPLDGVFASLSNPPIGDALFPMGFPRQGGLFSVDTAAFSTAMAVTETPRFDVTHGPALRMAVRFVDGAPEAMVALAGGQVADPGHAHFGDGMERWRRGAYNEIAVNRQDVMNRKETRELLEPTSSESAD